MIPTPAPDMMSPVVCGATVTNVYVADRARSDKRFKDNYFLSIIATDGPFAWVAWGLGDGGGQSIYRHLGRRWCRIANGGGAMGKADVMSATDPVHGARLWAKSGNH
jgi:hypothetical protein